MENVRWRVSRLGLRDCKASTWESLRRLEDYGIGPDRARMVVVTDETGTYHAIAVIDGVWALDSRQRDVVTIAALRAQGYSISPLVDRPLQQTTSQTATAGR